jgi:hypothetical protein
VSERTRTAAGASGLAAAALLSLLFAACVLADLAPWLRGPAPYPPEWQWEQRYPLAWPAAGPWALLVAVAALVAASALPSLRRDERRAAGALLAAAVVLGTLLPVALLGREPSAALRALLARTTSFSITSYHTVAVSEEARDPLAFVRRHAELLPQLSETAKHAATHPPGPVLVFRGAVAVCERSPALTDALLDAASVPRRDFPPPLTRAARAGALLGALVFDLLAALTAWPLAALARGLGFGPLAAARLALLWVVLPGPALVAPRVDAALALPVAGFAALLLTALRHDGAALGWRAALAGGCAGAALWLSYGAAVFLVIAGLAVVAADVVDGRRRPGPAASWNRIAATLVLATAVAALAAFAVPALLGGQPLRAMLTALAIHRQTYTAPRRYALWLLFDPIDFAALIGVPLAFLALARAAADALALARRRALAAADALALAAGAALAVLVASGTARGEVGRLWIPLMPLVLLSALRPGDAESAPRMVLVALCLSLLTVAMAAAWRL